MTNTASHLSESPDFQAVVREVYRLIDLESAELDDEFFPAHLSVALIDAVFNPQLNYKKRVVPIIERYCDRFGLCRLRRDKERLPPIHEQETLTDLIEHYEVLGQRVMREEVFNAQYCSPGPGPTIRKSENVRLAAVALREMGVETLQDAESTSPEEIKRVLRPLRGIADRTIRMLLMYVGNDDLVKGDVHVIRFVANAIGRNRVTAEVAERLVAAAARSLDIAPRLLDNEIWKAMSSDVRCNSDSSPRRKMPASNWTH